MTTTSIKLTQEEKELIKFHYGTIQNFIRRTTQNLKKREELKKDFDDMLNDKAS